MARKIESIPKDKLKKIHKLLEQEKTVGQIAKAVKMDHRWVGVIRKAWLEAKNPQPAQPEVQAQAPALGTAVKREGSPLVGKLRKALRRALPLEERVKILVRLARSPKDAVAMRALERIDQIEGVDAALKDGKLDPHQGPLFSFPPGTQIDMTPITVEEEKPNEESL
jgi:hypothetical protein